ncbi:uncharacterized protein LY89DRAFT_780956 [Mollisia scopiformis]|uniref:Uncharacterized protein n=1 Tax=Mollisia scopiformis TaxID=149040 RepID=A0A194XFP9_MOLSC|nr:uncharacterized protein LY89DRAFT_780956 [Mollisia scopiformis]KUJ18993.1 hypothetical protein LY89DRAFT_780956 [Mollisia scopiformis]
MSNPSAPSIPTSPPPGKDPPPPSATTSEPFPPLTTETPPPTLSKPEPPIRPTITTQPPSRSTTFHASTSEEPHPVRPPFSPFFTLINDVKEKESESSTYHPSRIHYLFSDDDASEVLSAALLRGLDNQPIPPPSINSSIKAEERESTTGSSSSATFKEKKSHGKKNSGDKGTREERIIIVDMNDTGDSIKSISSLSERWQVLNAHIDNAPTWDGSSVGEGEEAAAGGLMLRIEGVSSEGRGGVQMGESEKVGVGEEEMQGLLEGFDRKMAVLRRVVGQQGDVSGHRRSGSGGSGESAAPG